MLFHFVMWLVKRDLKEAGLERQRGLQVIYAARTTTGGNSNPLRIAAVVAKCHSWVREYGLASPQSARFFDEVARWTGNFYAVFGAVEITTIHGDQVRHWYVAEVNNDLKVIFADMISFDPSVVALADLRAAKEEASG